jgi:hypothetical protein
VASFCHREQYLRLAHCQSINVVHASGPENDDASASHEDASHHHQEVGEGAGNETHVEPLDQSKHHEQSEFAAYSLGHADVDDGQSVPNGGAHVIAEPPDELHHASNQHHKHHAGNEEADHQYQEHELDTSATTEQIDEHVAHHPDENVAHHSEEHVTRHVDDHIAESSEAEKEDKVPQVDIDIVENGQQQEDKDVRTEQEGSNGPGVDGLLARQDSLAGVDEILQSPAIRREIDEIIGHQLRLAPAANDLLAMQQLSDYLLPKSHGVGAGHIGKGELTE